MRITLKTAVAVMLAGMLSAGVQAQWVQTSGPQGGEVEAFTQKGDTLWAGTYGGLHFSTDAGVTWSFHSMPRTFFQSLHANSYGVFAGTNSQGFYRLDAAGTWEKLGGGLGATISVTSIATWRQRMFLTDNTRIYWSDDSGATWAECATQPTASTIYAVASHPLYLLSASWGGGVFRSADSGATWTAINTGLPVSPSAHRLHVADTVMFVHLAGALYRSVDNGDNWSACSGPSGAFSACRGIASVNDTVFVSSGNAVLRSVDLGAAWDTSLALPSSASFGALSAGGRVFMSSKHGIHYSTDNGATWQKPAVDVIVTYVNDIISAGDSILAFIYQTGTSRSADNGAVWTSPAAPGFYYPQDVAWLGPFLVGKEYSSLLRSSDSGHTWSDYTVSSSGSISRLLVAGGTLYAATYSRGVFRSTDSGVTWDSVNNGLPGRDVRALCSAGGTIFAGLYPQGVFRLDTTVWTSVNSGILQDSTTRNISTLESHGSTVLVGLDNYYSGPAVYVSNDLGASWAGADTGVTQRGCNSLYLIDTLIVGVFNYYELFATADHGASWHAFDEGMDSVRLADFVLVNDTIFAGSEYHGVWKRPLSELYEATQPSAVIPVWQRVRSIDLLSSYATTFSVYDLSGRLVRNMRTTPMMVRQMLHDHALLRGCAHGVYLVKTNATGERTFAVRRPW